MKTPIKYVSNEDPHFDDEPPMLEPAPFHLKTALQTLAVALFVVLAVVAFGEEVNTIPNNGQMKRDLHYSAEKPTPFVQTERVVVIREGDDNTADSQQKALNDLLEAGWTVKFQDVSVGPKAGRIVFTIVSPTREFLRAKRLGVEFERPPLDGTGTGQVNQALTAPASKP